MTEKEALAQPDQGPNKDGSPCPEFWDWLPKAYNFDGDGAFTKYNMEVAFIAGKQSAQPEEPEHSAPHVEPVGFTIQAEIDYAKCNPKEYAGFWANKDDDDEDWIALYTTPPTQCKHCSQRSEERAYKPLTGDALLSAAQSCLSPSQYDHFEALIENDQDAHNRLARAIENERGK